MTRLLILDSGAFSVWAAGAFSKKKAADKNTQQHRIDLDQYIQFCADHPSISYYVNLDVIPGKPRDKRSLTTEAIKVSCAAGYVNWLRMLFMLGDKLGRKVIPVFHQNDPVEYLDLYLDKGVEYIGISPANDASVGEKLRWLRSIRSFLFDGAGRPTVKTHGFAVTTYKLMQYMPWHSVDSASWKLWAGWGVIYVPVKTGGRFDYSREPLILGVSPASKKVSKHQHHILSTSPGFKDAVKEYLASVGCCLGRYEVVKVKSDYKLKKSDPPGDGEVWYRKGSEVLRPLETGVMTSFRERTKANIRFVLRGEKVLPVDHIYFAGAPMPYWEDRIDKRLLSYHEIGQGRRENKCLNLHIKMVEEAEDAKGVLA